MSVHARAMRSRTAGSSSASGLTDRAEVTMARRSAARMASWVAMPTRSWPRVPMATIHPSPSPPSRQSTGIRASVK